MDNTRKAGRRKPSPLFKTYDTGQRIERALEALQQARHELNQTGETCPRNQVLDWAMGDVQEAMRRCKLYMEAKT